MGMQEIKGLLEQKERLMDYAEGYMYKLVTNPLHKRMMVSEKDENVYMVYAKLYGKEIEFKLTIGEIYHIIRKCSNEERVKYKLDNYMGKRIYKEFLLKYHGINE